MKTLFKWALKALPKKEIIRTLLKWLENCVKKTDNKLDDEAFKIIKKYLIDAFL